MIPSQFLRLRQRDPHAKNGPRSRAPWSSPAAVAAGSPVPSRATGPSAPAHPAQTSAPSRPAGPRTRGRGQTGSAQRPGAPGGPQRHGPVREARRARTAVPFVALAAQLGPGEAAALTDAVLTRALRPEVMAATVILDLRSAAEIGADACAAVCGLRDKLAQAGATLLVVVASREARAAVIAGGTPHRLEAEAVHLSLHSAALAAYAALPGPGLVTGAVRDALSRPPEPLFPRPEPARPARRARSASPAEDGAPPRGGCWTGCSPGSTA